MDVLATTEKAIDDAFAEDVKGMYATAAENAVSAETPEDGALAAAEKFQHALRTAAACRVALIEKARSVLR